MPKNNETTTKFKVDISELKSGIQEANRQIRLANAEFKAASSSMDDWSTSADGLNAKVKQLESVLDAEKRKLASLNSQLQLTEKEYGSNSAAADELRIKIANQKSAINKTERSLSDFRSELSDVERSSDSAADDIKALGDAAEETEKKSSSLAQTLSGGLKKGLVGIGAATAGAITGFLATGEASQEYIEDMGKLEAAFTSSGHSAETAQKSYEGMVGILGETDQSVEAVNHLAKLTKNEEELAKWTDIAAGIYGTFGDSLPIEGLTEAANETAKVGKVTGPLADALNWAGISEDKFNEQLAKCNSEQERATLITNTLNKTYEEAADAYKDVNSDLIESRKATSKMSAAMSEMGKVAMPITTSLKNGFTDLLLAIVEMIGDVDVEAFTGKIEDGFKYIIDNVLPPIKSAISWVIDNKDAVIAGIAGIGAAMVTMNVADMIFKAVKAFKAFKAAQEGATVAQWLMNAAMNANPIGIVVAAITGLVTAFVVLWKKSETFRNFWIGLWDKIKTAVGKVVDWLLPIIDSIWQTIQTVWNAIKPYLEIAMQELSAMFTAAWEAIKAVWDLVQPYFQLIWDTIKAVFSVVGEVLSGFFSVAWESIKGVWDLAVSYFTLIWENIKTVFSVVKDVLSEFFSLAWTAIKAVWDVVVAYFKTIWNNIKLIFSVVKDVLSGNFGDAWDAIKQIFGNVGKFFGTVWDSIKKVFAGVGTFFTNSFSSAWEGVKKVFSNFTSFFSDIWESIKTIFSNVGGAISEAVTNTVSKAINTVLSTAVKIINGFISAINTAIGVINEIPGVDIDKLDKLEVPELWQGGIAKKGQKVLLEGKGDEAVVPLHNNKKWIRKTSQDLKKSLKDEGMIGSAETRPVVNNYNFTQNNTSPKALSRLDIYRQTKNQLMFAKGV